MKTEILPVDANNVGSLSATQVKGDILDELDIRLANDSPDAQHLQIAAKGLRTSDIPIAFPTETVYGLGADATRSAAVKGIYKAKQRPSDNPLIVHFASLKQLRSLLRGYASSSQNGIDTPLGRPDPIPKIYGPVISRFWPGPLTIILPNPANSPLAPEVTAGLDTFGARIPRHPLALALIQLADVPVAAPSANASTKPSPTAAEHVANDLWGRIETIIDGGPCNVGVESTVVDGLADPPLILRPGGISLEQIRDCTGWENTQIGYQNTSETGNQPRAPGMKYRHYSPRATVILFEAGQQPPSANDFKRHMCSHQRVGIIRTRFWRPASDQFLPLTLTRSPEASTNGHANSVCRDHLHLGFAGMLRTLRASNNAKSSIQECSVVVGDVKLRVLDINLGFNTADIARGIFSALRDLDQENVDSIFVEGIDDDEGDTAAAIMNRLRKAAEIRISS